MSILIRGIDMPTDGEMLCINIYPDGKVCIALDLECTQIATAVSIPPHGRLIDADALMDEAYQPGAYGYVDAIQIDNAPTIIPAEEGE